MSRTTPINVAASVNPSGNNQNGLWTNNPHYDYGNTAVDIRHRIGKPATNKFGIPSLNANDGPNGWAKGPFPGPPRPSASRVTAFPSEIALVATWDRKRASDFVTAITEESRGKGSSEIICVWPYHLR